MNEGIHLVFDDGRHQGNHLFKLFVVNTEDCNNLVSRQHQIFFKSHRVRNFILRKGFALNGRIGTQCHSVLLDGAEFVEGVAQGVHHFFLHARLEVICRLNQCRCSFLLFLCADNIHNILCGVDGFMGDFADAQVVFLRNADNKEQDEDQEECDNSHQDTFETRRTKPFREGFTFCFPDFHGRTGGCIFAHCCSFPSFSLAAYASTICCTSS